MATKIALKVSYNNDVRKITSSPDLLYSAIAERYGLELSNQRIELRYQDCAIDLDMLDAVASTLEPGKSLKVEMTVTDAPPPYSPSSGGCETVHQGIWCDSCGSNPITGPRHYKQLEGDTFDLCNDCFDQLDVESQQELTLKSNPSPQCGDANVTAKTEEMTDERDPQKLREMAEQAKLKANATKLEAKKLATCAKQEAQLAKNAVAAAKKAEKAYMKAEALAKKQAQKAEAAAKKQARQQAKIQAKSAQIQVTHGKLVNWCDKDCPALLGELTALPCGRLCFHADAHPGNLRVNEEFVIQKNGGRGTYAQFEAVPCDDKPGVFRLLSHQHREDGCYLGVDPSDSFNAALCTASGNVFEFALVPHDSTHGLWSFYPDGDHTPTEIAPPAPLPEPREVYNSMQQYIDHLAAATKIPISMGDAPDDDAQLVEMLNLLHHELPHGLKRIAMKKLGLRQFEPPQPEAVPQEWDSVLEDLKEMGFECQDQNLKAVQNAQGDLKQAVKELRMQELATRDK